jgi:hypothetical protein
METRTTEPGRPAVENPGRTHLHHKANQLPALIPDRRGRRNGSLAKPIRCRRPDDQWVAHQKVADSGTRIEPPAGAEGANLLAPHRATSLPPSHLLPGPLVPPLKHPARAALADATATHPIATATHPIATHPIATAYATHATKALTTDTLLRTTPPLPPGK